MHAFGAEYALSDMSAKTSGRAYAASAKVQHVDVQGSGQQHGKR